MSEALHSYTRSPALKLALSKMSIITLSESVNNCPEPFLQIKTPTRKDWEVFRGLIIYLYQERDHKLQDVIDLFLREFNFRATCEYLPYVVEFC